MLHKSELRKASLITLLNVFRVEQGVFSSFFRRIFPTKVKEYLRLC